MQISSEEKKKVGFCLFDRHFKGFPLTPMEGEGCDWERSGRREKGGKEDPREALFIDKLSGSWCQFSKSQTLN